MNGRLGRPSNDFAGEQIQDHSKVEPTLPRADIGDVSNPCLVRLGHRELALKQVGNQRRDLRRLHLPRPVAMQGAQAVLSHQSLDSMLAARLALLAHIQHDARSAIDTVTCNERGPYQSEQSCVFLGAVRDRTLQPSVVTGSSDAQEPTHRNDAKPVSIRLDEGIGFPRLALSLAGHGRSPVAVDEC